MSYRTESLPDDHINFEFKIRRAHVYVESSIWFDENGIYKTRINGVYMDGTEVSDLLTDGDFDDITDAIEPAAMAESGDRRATGSDTIPGPSPTL